LTSLNGRAKQAYSQNAPKLDKKGKGESEKTHEERRRNKEESHVSLGRQNTSSLRYLGRGSAQESGTYYEPSGQRVDKTEEGIKRTRTAAGRRSEVIAVHVRREEGCPKKERVGEANLAGNKKMGED